MGQSASKGLREAAGKVAKQATSLKRPPIPSRTPHVPTPSPGNPGSFLRGEGIAAQDERDRGQEMYLQHVQQQNQKIEQSSADGTPAATSTSTGNTDMPADLLKFIQDVGPAKQSVDREYTTTRLLEEENQEELNKVESVRTAKRERVRMPLMEGDDNFTTEKNTNFSVRDRSTSASPSDKDDFSLSDLQLYDFLSQKDKGEDERIVRDFHEKILSDYEEGQPNYSSPKGKELKEKELQLLSQTLNVVEIPTLRINADGDILGLYSKDVPGPEMTSISSIPESKIIMVLKDLSMNSPSNEIERATGKFKELARKRKAV